MIPKDTGRPSTPSLFADAFTQVATLFQAEMGLLRSEVSEKLSQAVKAVVILVAAAVLVLVALVIILEGVVEALVASGWKPYAASFLVGVVVALAGVIAALGAAKGLSPHRLTPKRSMKQLSKVVRVVEEQTQ